VSAPEVTVATGPGSGLRPGWRLITVAATAASTYALDTVATGPAVLLSDSVSSKDALIILGGANCGAAVYEYGLS
jgi:hypothetical protein